MQVTSEFGYPNSVLAVTQDRSLVLGVGYGCSQYNLPKKKEQEIIAPAHGFSNLTLYIFTFR
jgi:hypothetical protein